jgi:chemotaxis response regulator CheB
MPGDEHESGHDVVVIGASAGGIEALKELVGGLPLGACHVLAEGAEISRGTIYVAPPDFHIQLEDGRVNEGGEAA